jgi:hypothetical protein
VSADVKGSVAGSDQKTDFFNLLNAGFQCDLAFVSSTLLQRVGPIGRSLSSLCRPTVPITVKTWPTTMGTTATRLSNPPAPHASVPTCDYREIALRKVADREAILAKYPNWRVSDPGPEVTNVTELLLSKLTPKESEIVHLDACGLVEKLATSEYSAVEVLTAFCKVAVASQDLTNCLTEIFFEEGFERARQLDDHLASNGKVVGPLHGLPVSVKDHILVKGHDGATGYASWAYKSYADHDAAVVRILRDAGAVIYVKTANPQTLLVSHFFFSPPFKLKLRIIVFRDE